MYVDNNLHFPNTTIKRVYKLHAKTPERPAFLYHMF